MDDTNARVRASAANAIRVAGPVARPAVPKLVIRLADEDIEVRDEATRSLNLIDPSWRDSEAAKSCVPSLVKLLRHKSPSKTGDDETRRVPIHAAEVLGVLGSHARDAVNDLILLLSDKTLEDSDRGTVIAALENIGGPRHVIIPALISCLVDESELVRRAAESALDTVDQTWVKSDAAKAAVPDLTAVLRDQNAGTRLQYAAVTLGRLGPSAKDALPVLEKLSGHENPDVAEAVKQAIQMIRGQ